MLLYDTKLGMKWEKGLKNFEHILVENTHTHKQKRKVHCIFCMIQSKHTEQFISISLSNVALVGTNQVQYHDDYSPVSLAARLCDKSMEKK